MSSPVIASNSPRSDGQGQDVSYGVVDCFITAQQLAPNDALPPVRLAVVTPLALAEGDHAATLGDGDLLVYEKMAVAAADDDPVLVPVNSIFRNEPCEPVGEPIEGAESKALWERYSFLWRGPVTGMYLGKA